MTQATSPESSRTNMAVGLAVLAVVLYVVAMAVAQADDSPYGWLWPVSGLLGGAAAVMGWTAGKPRPRGKALVAVALGGLVFVTVLGWIIWALATGNF